MPDLPEWQTFINSMSWEEYLALGWRDLVTRLSSGVDLTDPATPEAIDAIAAQLGQPVPDELRSLLLETNGIYPDTAMDVVFSAEKILAENREMRGFPDFRELFDPFEPLMLFGAAGNGDLFGIVREPLGTTVFHWDHESDERTEVATDLREYIVKRLTDGDVHGADIDFADNPDADDLDEDDLDEGGDTETDWVTPPSFWIQLSPGGSGTRQARLTSEFRRRSTDPR